MSMFADRSQRWVAALLIVLSAATSIPASSPSVAAQSGPAIDRFTVTDASGDETAPRVDGHWLVYEDARRQTLPPTSTPTPTTTLTPTPVMAPIGAVPASSAAPGRTPDRVEPLRAMTAMLDVTTESDIRVHNLETGDDRRITSSPNARHPDVAGDLAVWSELGDDGNWGIVIYNLDARSILRRIDRAGNQQYPTISGRRIVWQDNRRGKWDIRAYDLDEQREFWVSESAADEMYPAI